jgi:putative endonuclease
MSGWVYIVRCADGTLYTGATTNVEERIKTHNAGKGAKYTRGRLPVNLVFCKEVSDYHEAQKLEYQIKQMTRKQKETLIAEYSNQ